MAIHVKDLAKNTYEMSGSRFTRCQCGYGVGFYCTGDYDGSHEYNPLVPEAQATAKRDDERQALATIFGHIDGRRVVLRVDDKDTSFLYKQHNNRKAAFEAAVNTVIQNYRQLPLIP